MTSLSEINKSIEKYIEERLRAISQTLELDTEALLEENKKLSKDVSLKRRKVRDPSRPKQPDNSYLLFTRDCRAIVKGESPSSLFPKSLQKTVSSIVKELKSQSDDGSLSSKLFTKRLGTLWNSKEMEKHQSVYKDEASQRREAFKKECAEYDAKKSSESKSRKSSTKKGKSSGKRSAKKTTKANSAKSSKKSKKEAEDVEEEEVEVEDD